MHSDSKKRRSSSLCFLLPMMRSVKCFMKILSVLLPFLVSGKAISCHQMIGTWQSSREMSMDYNLKSKELKDNQIEFLSQTLGVLKLTYTESTIRSHPTPKKMISIKGKEYEFVLEDLTYSYNIVQCKDNWVKTKQHYPYGDPITVKMHFISDDVYWVSPNNLPASREYFLRISR